MSHRNLLDLPDNPPRFPVVLETDQVRTAPIPRDDSLFGRMAEQSSLTGCEPNSLIEISSEDTPVNVSSRRNGLGTDLNDVPTAVAASDVAEIHDERQLTSPLFTQK